MILAAACSLPIVASPLVGYFGPGGALSGLGAILSLAGAVLLALVGFVRYPVKRWLRARKSAEFDADTAAHEDPQVYEDRQA